MAQPENRHSQKPAVAKTETLPKQNALAATVKNSSTDLGRHHERRFMLFALGVLLVTTIVWSFLAAKLQQGNADQLVNTYLFEYGKTFHEAVFPAAHTFLIKWPLFFLLMRTGATNLTFQLATVAVTLLTVGGLAFVLYRINKQPLVLGALFLALASILLLVPPQPYPGGILPVNTAMLTTRNIEYIVYILALVLLIKAGAQKRRAFWLAVGCFSLLMASDKLFAALSIGGAIIALVVTLVIRKRDLIWFYVDWLLASLLAVGLATVILWLLHVSRLTHITTQLNSGPFGLVHSIKGVAIGSVYLVIHLLTNLGANPVSDVTVLKTIPHTLVSRIASPLIISFIINGAILALAAYLLGRQVLTVMVQKKSEFNRLDGSVKLSMALFWSSLAATGAFIFTNHYYVADARYLTIILFVLFISAATYLRNIPLINRRNVWLVKRVLLVSISFGLIITVRTYNTHKRAMSDINHRNGAIDQLLKAHPVDTLVGDYWRVLPIKDISPGPLTITPLKNCLQPLDVLSSQDWHVDLDNHSFAYILSLDKNLTNFPSCTLDQVIAKYGKPNASTVIAGNLTNPKEILLFYDRGANKSAPSITLSKPSTVEPIALSLLPNTQCTTGNTVLNIVAHQDDDLLFMSPDLQHNIRDGLCVRTVYITAGDAGANSYYWLGREQGSEAAYSYMLNSNALWIQRIVKLADDQFITVANLRGNSRVSLIFIRLPDGNLNGQGFKNYAYESLARLRTGKVSVVHGVDRQSSYSSQQLTTALIGLMRAYHPQEIHTQATYSLNNIYPDHSDHLEVGKYTKDAYLRYDNHSDVTIKYYTGYPSRALPQNVFGDDLTNAINTFIVYAQHDRSVCNSREQCSHTPTYGSYLKTQYIVPDR